MKISNIRSAYLAQDEHRYADSKGIEARFSISQIANKDRKLAGLQHVENAATVGSYVHKMMYEIIMDVQKYLTPDCKTHEWNVIDFEKCLELATDPNIFSTDESKVCARFFGLLMDLNLKKPQAMAEASFMAEFNGITVAGTPDLILRDCENNEMFVIDFKTGKMGGFKKEHHLQVYGYSLFLKPYKASKIHCYTLHPEGTKHLFSEPTWVVGEFEANLNYLLEKDKAKTELQVSQEVILYLESWLEILEDVKTEKAEAQNQIKLLEQQEETLLNGILTEIEKANLTLNDVITSDKLSISLQQNRRHQLPYNPALEPYYDSTISEEYALTFNGKSIKIKRKRKDNE